MAIPFYNQGDQEIYESGQHFIPQERYRLGYTAPPSIANASTGITNTQVAAPYIWPPQGGAGGDINYGNKFNLNLDTMKTISSGKYVEKGGPGNMYGGDYVKTDRQIAQDKHGNWKDIKTNQNVYHGNLHGVKGIVGTIGDWMTGKSKNKDTRIGTWTGAEWDDEFDPTVANRDLNVYTRWKAKKEFKAAQEKAAADKVAADAAVANKQQWQQDYSNWQSPSGRDHAGTGGIGSPESKAGGAPGTAEASSDWRAEGGRIGYRWGESVDPEEPSENIFEFMQDQGVPYDQMASDDNNTWLLENLFEKYLDLGFSPAEAEKMALDEFEQRSMGPAQDQGIASLV
tara:strand:- start:105 stop:1130 length:1026 start_codon:yes stop_codon:yes gene_type:complete